jgi:TM2 domain-containing membrane protein YozV
MKVSNMEVKAKKKNPGLAAIASFFILGVGQIYSGEVRKCIGFIITGVIFGSITLFLLWQHRMLGPLLVSGASYLLFWMYNVYDAYRTSEAINFRI